MRRLAVVAAMLAVLVTGCSGQGDRATGTGTVLIGAARTGSPLPGWSTELEQRFRADLARRASWAFVSPDGRPTVVDSIDLVVTGDNDLVLDAATEALRAEAVRRLGAVRADDPEVDVLAALTLAVRVLADQPGPKVIILQDGLLQTSGVLRFQDHDGALLSADPAEVAARLDASGDLPMLDGIAVVLIGAGDTVAPQDALPAPVRAALIAIWTAVLQRAGAEVRVVEAPVAARAGAGLPTVTPVPVAPPRPVDGPVALHDSTVGFLPDQAVLRDRGQATTALAPFAQRLLAGGVRVRLTGTTSSAGTAEGRLTLSRERAATVAAVLRDAGVAAELIDARGVGADFPGFVPDRDASGRLDPVLAAVNRQVIIELIPVAP